MTPSVSTGPPLLSFDLVTKRRARGRETDLLLDQVSFEIAAGELVDLRGPQRRGKTALLRIAAGIDLPDDGTVTWRGTTTSRPSRRQRTRRLREIAFVAQANDWRAATGMPMLDHVALPLIVAGAPVWEAYAAAHTASEEVGGTEFLDLPPHELPADALMRLSLARALVCRPLLIVLDAPGDGATDVEQQGLQRHLITHVRERRGLALLIASREASALRGADRAMTLDGSGRLLVPDRAEARVLPFPVGAPTP